MFEKAVSSQDEKEINSAVSEYYDLLSKYFDDFLHREFSGTGKEAIEIGGEQKVVEQFGEENIILFIGVLLGKIQKDVTAVTGALDFSSENDVITLRWWEKIFSSNSTIILFNLSHFNRCDFFVFILNSKIIFLDILLKKQ